MNLAATRWRAPAVLYPVGRSAVLAAGCGSIAFGGLLALGYWAAQGAWRHPWWVVGAVFATWIVVVAFALRFWRALPAGDLHWGGAHWELKSAGRSVDGARLRVHADLQRFMLVRLESADQPPCWLWLERRAHPERWNDLRRAVYSRAETAGTNMPLDPSPPAG